MPLPEPKDDEKKEQFIKRCMSNSVMNEDYSDSDQRLAVCNSQWKRASEGKNMNANDSLLQAVRTRNQKEAAFHYGILTADRYVHTLKEVAGLPACYRWAPKGTTSFHDVMMKAAQTLVYSHPDMIIGEKRRDQYSELSGKVELPKNTLMVFKHVLTTSKKDRDGDILRTEGMTVDPKMLLLWQHVHTMPIGKMLKEVEHNTKRLSLISCIIDINEICHDAAVMVDNDMGRFSHGFTAFEFDKVKGPDGDEVGGFDVKRGEIMEESLVSVPANTDAETQEVLLSLIEGGKLTSPIMKDVGRGLRDMRAIRVPVKLDLKVSVNGQEVQSENESGNGKAAGTSDKGQPGTSEKADGTDDGNKETKAASDTEVKALIESDITIRNKATLQKAIAAIESSEKGVTAQFNIWFNDDGTMQVEQDSNKATGEKQGRVLSKGNEGKIKDAKEDIDDAAKMEGLTRSCKALLKQASGKLGGVLSSLGAGGIEEPKESEPLNVKDAMSHILAHASKSERDQLGDLLDTLKQQDKRDEQVRDYHALIGVQDSA